MMLISRLPTLVIAVLTGLALFPETASAADAEVIHAGKASTAVVDLGLDGMGSSFCIRSDGLFLTNEHVVASKAPGDSVTLILNPSTDDQQSIQARLLKMDSELDLALLQALDVSDLPALTLGDDSKVRETQDILFFGYPFGRMLSPNQSDAPAISVNTGKISALRRQAGRLAAIQLNADANPGNSGGPLLNEKGEVIGILSRGMSNAGISFAIPSSAARRFLDEPGLHVQTKPIPFNERFQTQPLKIDVFELNKHPEPLSIEVSFPDAKGNLKTVKASKTGDSYTAKVGPFYDRKAAAPLEVFVQVPGKVLACDSKDYEIRVGRRSFRLEEVQRIENRAETAIVTTISREKYAGKVSRLPQLQDRATGEAVPWAAAEVVEVYAKSDIAREAPYSVTMRRGKNVVRKIDSSLQLKSAPALVDVSADSELWGGLPWLARKGVVAAETVLKSKIPVDRFGVRWYPLKNGRPFQYLKFGPFPMGFNSERVLDFISKADFDAALGGRKLTPMQSNEEQIPGSLLEGTEMYYVFFIRSPKAQRVKTTFETFTRWDNNKLDVLVDSTPVNLENSSLSLGAGDHLVVIKQNHYKGGSLEYSWIRFLIEGENLEFGVFPHLGLVQEELYAEFLKKDFSSVVWNDLPADMLVRDALVLGPFSQDDNEAEILNALANFDVNGDWRGYSLMPQKPPADGAGKYSGPLPENTSQYYMFLVQVDEQTNVSWNAQSMLDYSNNTVQTFLDFVPVDRQGETDLTPGVHAIVVRQNRNKNTHFDNSWVSLALFGDGIKIGSAPGRQPPQNELFSRYLASPRFDVEWQPQNGAIAEQCLTLGPFPFNFDEKKVLEFLSKGDPNGNLEGKRLTRIESPDERLYGPTVNETLQYYVFLVRTPHDQTVKVDFETFILYQHSWLDVFVDFRRVFPDGNELPLQAGEHVIVICQHHNRSDGQRASWVKFFLEGEDIEVGLVPSLELIYQESP